ncbi:MAG: hypothetical protein ACREOK_04015 [Gemmatimonadaceae bacterium]
MTQRRAIAVISLAGILGACEDLPRKTLITPELTGRLTRSGVPVVDATIAVMLRPESDTTRACRDDLTSTRTDSTGSFLARAYLAWMRRETVEELERSGERFQLCAKRDGESEYRLLFQSVANRWDRMTLHCDLDRSWLAPDVHGAEGRCVVLRVELEGQEVAQRQPSQRPPALTCDTTATLLTSTSIGPIKRWAPLEGLRRLCGPARDTVIVDWTFDDAGQRQRAFVYDISGHPIVFRKLGELVQDVVVTSDTFRTADGFGVGTPVARLLEKPDLKVAFNSEPPRPHAFYFAWHGEECGVGYAIQPPPDFRGRPGGMIPRSEIRDWPSTMRISRVYIGWCPGAFIRMLSANGR